MQDSFRGWRPLGRTAPQENWRPLQQARTVEEMMRDLPGPELGLPAAKGQTGLAAQQTPGTQALPAAETALPGAEAYQRQLETAAVSSVLAALGSSAEQASRAEGPADREEPAE